MDLHLISFCIKTLKLFVSGHALNKTTKLCFLCNPKKTNNNINHLRFFFVFFNKVSILTVSLSKMNPRESAAFIASVSKDVEINPDGIRKIASEVLFLFTFVFIDKNILAVQ